MPSSSDRFFHATFLLTFTGRPISHSLPQYSIKACLYSCEIRPFSQSTKIALLTGNGFPSLTRPEGSRTQVGRYAGEGLGSQYFMMSTSGMSNMPNKTMLNTKSSPSAATASVLLDGRSEASLRKCALVLNVLSTGRRRIRNGGCDRLACNVDTLNVDSIVTALIERIEIAGRRKSVDAAHSDNRSQCTEG